MTSHGALKRVPPSRRGSMIDYMRWRWVSSEVTEDGTQVLRELTSSPCSASDITSITRPAMECALPATSPASSGQQYAHRTLIPARLSPLQGPPRQPSGGGLLGEGPAGGGKWMQGAEAGCMLSRLCRTRRQPSPVQAPYPPHEAAQTATQGLHLSAARAQRGHQGPPLQRQRTAERLPSTPMDEARGLSTAAGLARVRTFHVLCQPSSPLRQFLLVGSTRRMFHGSLIFREGLATCNPAGVTASPANSHACLLDRSGLP